MPTLVTIDAKPEPLRIDPARTAVIVVDMQNDFGHERGMFGLRGIDVAPIRQAIGPTKAVLSAARKAGAKVVYLKMEFDPDLSNAGLPDLPNRIKHRSLKIGERMAAPDGTEGRILIKDTWNTQILDELRPEPEDLIVSKHRYSGFYGTNLDEKLRGLGITPPGFYRMHDERLCRVDDARCDVQGLLLRPARRLQRRTDRCKSAAKQP
jgi:ureidoacrylate peracid hydrolase